MNSFQVIVKSDYQSCRALIGLSHSTPRLCDIFYLIKAAVNQHMKSFMLTSLWDFDLDISVITGGRNGCMWFLLDQCKVTRDIFAYLNTLRRTVFSSIQRLTVTPLASFPPQGIPPLGPLFLQHGSISLCAEMRWPPHRTSERFPRISPVARMWVGNPGSRVINLRSFGFIQRSLLEN